MGLEKVCQGPQTWSDAYVILGLLWTTPYDKEALKDHYPFWTAEEEIPHLDPETEHTSTTLANTVILSRCQGIL